jgi:hypothetical protein
MIDHYAALKTFKESECRCKQCRTMCHTPCSGTPEDIEALIEAGYGDRLSLDWHCGFDPGKTIFKLTPALHGYEGKQAAEYPYSEKGCTFFSYGKCRLHGKGLKPTSGKLAFHDTPREPKHLSDVGGTVHASVTETWDTLKGRTLVAKWCEARGVPIEEVKPTAAGSWKVLTRGVLDDTFSPEKGIELLKKLTDFMINSSKEAPS